MILSVYGCCLLFLLLPVSMTGIANQDAKSSGKDETLPTEVRGYKIHRARVEMKENKDSEKKKSGRRNEEKGEYDEDEPLLIQLGEAKLVSVSPLGVTFDVPVILAAVKQQGDVDLLVFENMVVNDVPVTLEDYTFKFKVPNKEPLTLNPPLRIFVSTPQAVLRTIDDIFTSREVWAVNGRIYVCGHFKKFLLKFKRAVPVEVQTTISNPLRQREN